MRINPVYKRESMISSRSIRLPMILMMFNSILALVALLSMYTTVAQVKLTAEIQYSSFLDLYVFVATMEFMLLLCIMPALTAGSISGEREHQTLELMLTTRMTPAQIITGKLAASLSTMFLLIVSSAPVIALVFVYGGITVTDIVVLLLCYITVALFTGALGICCSAIFKKSTIATIVSYSFIGVFVIGTYIANTFAQSISRMNLSGTYIGSAGNAVSQATSGETIYTLLLNPAVTFYLSISHQTGTSDTLQILNMLFGPHSSSFVIKHWVFISNTLLLVMAAVMIWIAVLAVNPVRKKKKQV